MFARTLLFLTWKAQGRGKTTNVSDTVWSYGSQTTTTNTYGVIGGRYEDSIILLGGMSQRNMRCKYNITSDSYPSGCYNGQGDLDTNVYATAHGSTTYGSTLYFNNAEDDSFYTYDMSAYGTSISTWDRAPSSLDYTCLTTDSYNERVFVIGGYDSSNTKDVSTVYSFDISSQS